MALVPHIPLLVATIGMSILEVPALLLKNNGCHYHSRASIAIQIYGTGAVLY
jgi:hypothetical protein